MANHRPSRTKTHSDPEKRFWQ